MATGFYKSAEKVESIKEFLSNEKFLGTAKHFYVNESTRKSLHHFLVKTKVFPDTKNEEKLVTMEMLHYTEDTQEKKKVQHHALVFSYDGTDPKLLWDREGHFDKLKAGKWFWQTGQDYPINKKDLKAAWKRALSRKGESNHSLVFDNSEHFVTWAVTGEPYIVQVPTLLFKVSYGIFVAAAALSFFRI